MTGATDHRKRADGIFWTLEQSEVWRDAAGNTHRLDTMDPRHRSNVLRWLRARAENLAFYHGLGACSFGPPLGDAAQDAFDAGLEELWNEQDDPREWLETTPLVKRLVELEGTS